MFSLNLAQDVASPLQVLCLGAHSDDIEIGCGGTILRITQQYPNCVVHWVVLSALGVRAEEARQGAERFAGTSNLKRTLLKNFQDGFFPFAGAEVKAVFEELKQSVSPDLIFTIIATMRTRITGCCGIDLEYFRPSDFGIRDSKYDGDLGQPSISCSSAEVARKGSIPNGYLRLATLQAMFQPETFLADACGVWNAMHHWLRRSFLSQIGAGRVRAWDTGKASPWFRGTSSGPRLAAGVVRERCSRLAEIAGAPHDFRHRPSRT